MEHLKFANPVFHPGLNLSVRRGAKWHAHHAKTVAVTDLDGKVKGLVTIITELRPFSEISEAALLFEHDPTCRWRDGLLASMQEVYDGFEPSEPVTLVWFIADFVE